MATKRRQVRIQPWAPICAILLCLPAVVIANSWLVEGQRIFCEGDAYLWGPTQLGHIFLTVPWVIVVFPINLMVINCAEAGLRLIAGNTDRQGFINSSRTVAQIFLWVSVPALLLSLCAFPSRYCVSPSGISLRTAIWSRDSQYHWEDVKGVATECVHSGRAQSDNYELVMIDDARINLAERKPEFIKAYPRISDSLQRVPLVFESRGLNKCPSGLRRLFSVNPGQSRGSQL